MGRTSGIATFALALTAGTCFGQLRVVTWNISAYTGSNRGPDIQNVVYGTFNGRQMAPDVIAAQEFSSASALTTFVGVLNSATGSPGDWAAAPFLDGPDSESVLVYRTSKVTFVRVVTVALGGNPPEQPRNTYRYDFRPAGYGDVPANTIAVYNVHLKSGDMTDDIARRLVETTRIRDNAETLPPGTHFMLAGDTNTQSSNQTAYVQLVGSQAVNTGRFYDPINSPGSWNNNGNYRYIHTQDPIGTGGMDDRHDQILVSAGLLDGVGMDYIGVLSSPQVPVPYSTTTWNDPNHSYRAWGNDGSSYNLPMTTTGNTFVGPSIATSIRNCAASGGHIPVYLDLRVPAKATTDVLTLDFGTVTQGSTPPARTIQVSNAGNTALWTVAGIANLSYTMAASSGFAAPGGGYSDPATPGGNSHSITMTTTTVGPRSGTLTITSNDPDQPTRVIQLVGNVVPPNMPPNADAGPDITITDSDNSGGELVTLDGSASNDADGSVTTYRWTEGVTLLSTGPVATANVVLSVGDHTITLQVTDNGGLTDTDTVIVHVLPGPSCSADYNEDGNVDQADVDYLINVISGGDNPTGADPDFNQDGNADQGDVDALINVVAGGDCP